MPSPIIIAEYQRGRFYPAGYVARKSNRHLRTIQRLHRDGIIPETKYRSTQGRRLYLPHQLEAIVFGFRRIDSKQMKFSELGAWLRARWDLPSDSCSSDHPDG